MSVHAASRADRLAARLAARTAGEGPKIVLIDGGAGSGKTSLAKHLAHRLGAGLVHLDSLYPGWGGLAAGAVAVETDVLGKGAYRRYDWGRGTLADWVPVALDEPLIIEGCGAITAGSMAAARRLVRAGTHEGSSLRDLATVWVECPEPVRRARALERDGELFRPHWDEWAAQEAAHLALHRPVARAREIIHTGERRSAGPLSRR